MSEPRGDTYICDNREAMNAVFEKWRREGQCIDELLAVLKKVEANDTTRD